VVRRHRNDAKAAQVLVAFDEHDLDAAHIPQEAFGSSRRHPRIPAMPEAKDLLKVGISADPRSPRKSQDRPVTPEVAGSSPVAPVSVCRGFVFAVVEELGAVADPTPVGVLGVRRKVCQRVLFPQSLLKFFSRLTDARRTCRRLHE
jgi:hypothetical protein